MRSIFLSVIFLIGLLSASLAQGRKLPAISFEEHSTVYANANRGYNEKDRYTDTLQDVLILEQLSAILTQNGQLLIEIVGHTAINESDTLGAQRADVVYAALVEAGIDSSRLTVVNEAHSSPIISDDVLFELPSAEEKAAANQKNRRVEIGVVGKREE
jgi:outer membrane protein OmpA-like peptidoglycan-associated protein